MYQREEPEINLEQILGRIRSFFGRFGFSGGGSIFPFIVIGVFVIALLFWLGTGFFTVQPGEQAAVRMLGKFTDIRESGLSWWWPTPIGARTIVQVDEVRRLELGIRGGTPVLSESLMITGDDNIVDAQLLVQYDVKDIENFLFRVVDPAGVTIKDVAETAFRQVVGSRPIDDVLTDQKEEVQSEVERELKDILDSYNSGINIREVKLLSVFAPEQVKDAFDDVVRAKEDRERIINLADAYKEDILPRARGEAARLVEAAEAFRQEKIAIATGQAERFLSILSEYSQSKEVTRKRLYLEAMEDVLPGITKILGAPGEVILVSPQTNVLPVPLRPTEGQP